jgi:hypothetical protein
LPSGGSRKQEIKASARFGRAASIKRPDVPAIRPAASATDDPLSNNLPGKSAAFMLSSEAAPLSE